MKNTGQNNYKIRKAFIGIENCFTALTERQQDNVDPQIKIAYLLTTFKQIREIFVEEFPDASIYKRPYFD